MYVGLRTTNQVTTHRLLFLFWFFYFENGSFRRFPILDVRRILVLTNSNTFFMFVSLYLVPFSYKTDAKLREGTFRCTSLGLTKWLIWNLIKIIWSKSKLLTNLEIKIVSYLWMFSQKINMYQLEFNIFKKILFRCSRILAYFAIAAKRVK